MPGRFRAWPRKQCPARTSGAGVGLRPRQAPVGYAAAEAFDLAFRPAHRAVKGLALLRDLGDHLRECRLSPHLGPDLQGRRVPGEARDRIVTRRIVVVGALGRPFVVPDLEVHPLVIGRNVEADAGGDQLFLDRSGDLDSQQALCRRDILREIPDRPVIMAGRVVPAFWPLRRMEGPQLLGDLRLIALGHSIGAGGLKISAALPETSALLFDALS